MKLTTGILAITITMAAGAAYAQNTDAIDNARSVAKSLQQKQANDTNAALDAAGTPASSSTPAASTKPAAGAPASAVKPAPIPGSQSVSYAPIAPAAPAAKASSAQTSAAKPVAPKAAAAKPALSAQNKTAQNKLEKVNVVSGADTIQIEMSSTEAVTPKVEKLSSPARIVVELPETAAATSQNKIAVNAGGVKGVRIGMDGKNPPNTSVVIDLETALAYELTPGAAGKTVLTLHTEGGATAAAKTAPVVAKAAPVPVVAKAPAPAAKPAVMAEVKDPFLQAKTAATAKAQAKAETKSDGKTDSKTVTAGKTAEPAKAAADAGADASKTAKAEEIKDAKKDEKKPEDKKWAMNGKRDPFFSPVVQQQGSGCSTGKKCLEIGNINLRGVVKSDNGFIAVVTNNLNKAYFLRENDPVFNGYVVKITGDSVTFQETVQDKLGKSSTREVVKRIFTPAV